MRRFSRMVEDLVPAIIYPGTFWCGWGSLTNATDGRVGILTELDRYTGCGNAQFQHLPRPLLVRSGQPDQRHRWPCWYPHRAGQVQVVAMLSFIGTFWCCRGSLTNATDGCVGILTELDRYRL